MRQNAAMRTAILLAWVWFLGVGASAAQGPLPYRFLLVIGEQWKDPGSFVIDQQDDFQILAALLKTWGLPFDILRLDQQRLDYHLFDRKGRPRYGTILWNAPYREAERDRTELVRALVREHGVNLVALGDTVAAPLVAELAGLEYVSEFHLGDGLSIGPEHFITRGLKEREGEFHSSGNPLPGSKVAVRGATVVARRGALPFLTVHEPGGGRVAWIGVQRVQGQLQRQIMRDLLKRSLVWAQGYMLYAEYPRSLLLFMDDMGTSDRTFLPYWHYRTLDEDAIRQGLIEPLKRHKAVMTQDIVTGYVDRKKRRVVNPWKLRVVDEIDGKTVHDYVSAKRGLEAGLREGVFEIASHGWTHMLPDLDSPPGPFWDAPMDGVGTLGWDVEFGDRLRGKDVPAILQRQHLARSLEDLQEDFGVRPLFLIAGGGAHSTSPPHHSQRIAAEFGFGLSSDFGAIGYLGRDMVIALSPIVQRNTWQYDRKIDASSIAWTIDAPAFLIFHDRDVSLDIRAAERLLSSLGEGVRYMAASEYCGYLHARMARSEASADGPAVKLTYDPHYCRYFADHESTWMLHLSDETRKALKGAPPEKRTIRVPKGTGSYRIQLETGQVSRGG
jgi:hypothetical protein